MYGSPTRAFLKKFKIHGFETCGLTCKQNAVDS